MANNALFINIATLLWAANISAVKDRVGNPIIPDTLASLPGGVAMYAFVWIRIMIVCFSHFFL